MSRYGKSAKSISAYKYRSSARSTTGEGYSTDRSTSRYSFEIRINHEKFDTTIAAAKRSIESEVNYIDHLFKQMTKGGKKGSGVNFSVSLKERKGSDLKKMVTTINSRLDGESFIQSMYENLAGDIGNIGVNNMRAGIQRPENPPLYFRYDTGRMYNSVRYKRKRLANEIVIEVGWLDTFYKYFDFQERGTSGNGKKGSRGIGAMNAIQRAYRSTSPEAYRLMSKFLRNYTNKGGFSGRYTR